MDSPAKLRSITKQYFALQGLRFTPVWLVLALRPWGGVFPNHRPFYIRDSVTMAMFVFCGVWIWLSGGYYRRRYGWLESKSQPWWNWLLLVAVLAAYFLCMYADQKNPPVSFVALLWACLLGGIGLATVGIPLRRLYYGVAAVSMAVVALVPSTGWITASRLLSAHRPSAAVFLGVIMTALGLLDHFQLVRMFEHPSEDASV